MSNSVKKTQNKGHYGVQGHSRSSRFVGKRVVDFPLALIELFSLGVTAEELSAIIS